MKPAAFYAWTKEFMEVGKERPGRNEVRDAAHHEIQQHKRENSDLKHLMAELSLDAYRLKKNGPDTPGRRRW